MYTFIQNLFLTSTLYDLHACLLMFIQGVGGKIYFQQNRLQRLELLFLKFLGVSTKNHMPCTFIQKTGDIGSVLHECFLSL